MYESHYGFQERPFSLLPDPMFLFPSQRHEAALAGLVHAFETEGAICVLTGAPGTGKTTLLRELIRRLPSGARVGLLSNSHSSITELLHWILAAFGVPCDGCGPQERAEAFRKFLHRESAKGRQLLVIFDEAQNLSPAVIEELRLFSNLNDAHGPPLQLLLAGQPALATLLTMPDLIPFTQRIACSETLHDLDINETAAYIRHRVRLARAAGEIFAPAACDAIFRHTSGNPRLINLLCDLCLVHGAVQGAGQITRAIVEAVLCERTAQRALPGFQGLDLLPVPSEYGGSTVGDSGLRKLLMPKRIRVTPQAKTQAEAGDIPAAPVVVTWAAPVLVSAQPGTVIKVSGHKKRHTLPDQVIQDQVIQDQATQMATIDPSSQENGFQRSPAAPRQIARLPAGKAIGSSRALIGAFVAGLLIAGFTAAVFLKLQINRDAKPEAVPAISNIAAPPTSSKVESARLKEILQQSERDAALAQARALERERDAALAATQMAIQARDVKLEADRVQREAAQALEQLRSAQQETAQAAAQATRALEKAAPASATPTAISPQPLEPSPTTSSPPAPAVPTLTEQEPRGFSANPCKGPSARFLSTCKD